MRPTMPVRRLGVLATVGVLVLAACGGAATPVPTSAPVSQAPASAGASAGAASPSAAAGALPKPELTTVKIGLTAASEMSQYAGVGAVNLKILDKYGITGSSLISFEGTAKGLAAVQSGSVDIEMGDSGSSVSSQLSDVPLVVVALNATILTDDLICTANIKTAADVKGKKIAISTFGGTSNASAILAVKKLGLALTDVTITQVGGESARIAALKGGSVDCGVVDKVNESAMTAAGLNIVTSIWKDPVQAFGRSGMEVTKSFLQKNPNTVLVVLAAMLESQNMVWTDPDTVAKTYGAFAQLKSEDATTRVKDFQTVGNRSLQWSDDAFKNAQKTLAAVNPDIIDVDITKAFDRSLLKKLVDNGFYKKINNPATCPQWTLTTNC